MLIMFNHMVCKKLPGNNSWSKSHNLVYVGTSFSVTTQTYRQSKSGCSMNYKNKSMKFQLESEWGGRNNHWYNSATTALKKTWLAKLLKIVSFKQSKAS